MEPAPLALERSRAEVDFSLAAVVARQLGPPRTPASMRVLAAITDPAVAQRMRVCIGAAQGSVLSPLLGNVYLRYVLDLWFEQEVKRRLRGRATLVRYADAFIIGFKEETDARR